MERLANIVLDELEISTLAQFSKICRVAGGEIIYADHAIAVGNDRFAEMGTQEPRRSAYQYGFLNQSVLTLFYGVFNVFAPTAGAGRPTLK